MSDPKPSAPQAPNHDHNEQHPGSGFIGHAAKLVESVCLLPEPEEHKFNFVRKWWRSFSYPRNYLSEKDCSERQIRAQAHQAHVAAPKEGEPDYAHIMRHAHEFAGTDAASCMVRNYEDKSETAAHQLFGYRGADHQCHVTPDQNVARDARKKYPQTR